MKLVSVTLEVLKLSGCSNAHANCRASEGEGIRLVHTMRGKVGCGSRDRRTPQRRRRKQRAGVGSTAG
eukprot:scaffold68502_cov61-Phaeocystis_antarctica.AAC.2